MAVESFMLFSLGALPPTSSSDSKTTLVWLSFKLYVCFHLSCLLVVSTFSGF